MALTEALHHNIETELDREQRPAHHFVNFAITAHEFTHAYQTANFTVGERTARLDEMLATLTGELNSNESLTPIAVSTWMWYLCPCQAQGPIIVKNIILDVDAWIEKTRKNDASSPSKTRIDCVALAPLSPCERTATKIKACTGFSNGAI